MNEFDITDEIEINEDTELTYELIKQLKDKHKKIWKTTLVDGTEIIWRRLNRKEYKKIMKDYEDIEDKGERLMEREDAVCRAAVLYPCVSVLNNILENMAGASPVISDDIYEKSGFRVAAPEEL